MPNQTTDFIPYLFLAAMIVIGGLVAFVADGMGRKIGKKRLSFLGLRPRYTATLITVGAGVLIPILTIGAIYLLSSEVREWIREGRGAIENARRYQSIADDRAKEVDELERKESELQSRNKGLSARNDKLASQLSTYEDQVADARQKVKASESLVKVARSRSATLQGKLDETNREISNKEKEINQTQALLRAGKGELAKLQGTFNTANQQFREINSRAIELDRQNSDLEKKLNSLQSDLGNLQAQKVEFEGQISSYKESVQAYQDSIREYNAKIEDLRQEAEGLSRVFQSSFMSSRTRPMIFEASQEVARVQLPPSLSPVAARNAFYDLLQRSRLEAIEKKARSTPNLPSAGLSPRQLNGRIVSEAEQEESIIRAITAQRNELVFIARSFFNAFEGEYVLLEFVAYRNRKVYDANQLIIERRVDGRKTEVEILNQIQDFVSTNVRAQALKDGMIPPSGRSGQLGTIEEAELLDLISEIKSYNQSVRLQALAKSEINAGDQLKLTFRVRL